MARGDHLRVWRHFYYHHGIDAGDGTVIHLTGEPLRRRGARVEHTEWETFARGGDPALVSAAPAGDVDAVMERAQLQVGREGYHLLFDNCEHFTRWCLAGRHESVQVDRWARVGCAAGTVALAAGRRLASRGTSRLAVGVFARCLGPAGAVVTVASVAVTAASVINRYARS